MEPPKGVYLPISKLHSILAVANLLAHNNITISYYVQVNSLRLKYTHMLLIVQFAHFESCED